MIYVTLGTQKFQMNRLVKAVDKLSSSGKVHEDFFVQTGVSSYKPKNCKYTDFVDNDKYVQNIKNCSVLITHAGVGTIIAGIKSRKPVIVVPRLAQYGEHVDDHQTQIAKAFSDKGCVLNCENLDELEDYIEKAKTYEFKDYDVKKGNVEETILHFMSMFS